MESSPKFWNVPETTGLFLHELAVFWAGARRDERDRFDVLEIGTSNGYSGCWLAKALKRIDKGGMLYTIESNLKRFEEAGLNFVNEGLDDYVVRILGHAPEVFEGVQKDTHTSVLQRGAHKESHTSEELCTSEAESYNVGGVRASEAESNNGFEWPRFDFVFFDATKLEYVSYLMAVLPLMKRGGLIVADNCLSHRKELAVFLHGVGKKAFLLPMDNGLLLLKAGDG